MNYWVDVSIGVAFILSSISGLVFLLPDDPTSGILGISYQVWSNVHTWGSLAMIAGVGAHLALHWKWMVSMTRRMLASASRQKATKSVPEPAYGEAMGTTMSRRAFLILGGAAMVAAGLVVTGYKAVFGTSAAETRQDDSLADGMEQLGRVACPRGLVNDPYPGKCRRYMDRNGDGICDYSVPG
jgi:hypothetical protein